MLYLLRHADNRGRARVGFGGCKLWAPRVILVSTRLDSGGAVGVKGDVDGADVMVTQLQKHYEADLIIEPHLFTVDLCKTADVEMTALKRSIADIKQFICQVRLTFVCIEY